MNSQTSSFLVPTPETQYSGPSSTASRIPYITGRLMEVRKLMGIHQEDISTQWSTYEEHLKNYHRARLNRFIASRENQEDPSSTADRPASSLGTLTTNEMALKDLVQMLHDNYKWMMEKVSVLQKEEKRLKEELDILKTKSGWDRFFTAGRRWNAEVFVREADGPKMMMDGFDASENFF
ncbi:uncharacterized protein LAJ45_03615 [Morchella importuna]|uniref:uncharacterized protein n=1 Tax=Morchella importuna TaxID=1174673 RepID=UPI001E8D0C41|nr:uncharacterized protein LAJ45_03615 [Morchella importuna]KAH8152189.1 hypothetical protein LAJ45_03615 [Morchella importuna]